MDNTPPYLRRADPARPAVTKLTLTHYASQVTPPVTKKLKEMLPSAKKGASSTGSASNNRPPATR